MADIQMLLDEAQRLGTLIGSQEAVKKFREVTAQIDLDVTAKGLLSEFEQLMETLAMKEATMQPIEVAEKQKYQSLQQSMAIHPLIQKLMAAQADYSDLMRKVQEAINKGVSEPAGENDSKAVAASSSKIILE
jgi:cell fate (sporulation/competence/biofilm development) regulator YlbF (YheA/YmcA/DUF963 family)